MAVLTLRIRWILSHQDSVKGGRCSSPLNVTQYSDPCVVTQPLNHQLHTHTHGKNKRLKISHNWHHLNLTVSRLWRSWTRSAARVCRWLLLLWSRCSDGNLYCDSDEITHTFIQSVKLSTFYKLKYCRIIRNKTEMVIWLSAIIRSQRLWQSVFHNLDFLF